MQKSLEGGICKKYNVQTPTQSFKEVIKMANTIDFSKKYGHLMIDSDMPKTQLQAYPYSTQIPKKYRKKFIHTKHGFVNLFCKEHN